jgi:hypothetical protein
MPAANNRTRKLLNIQRCSEQSRLEGQVIAAVYELLTPLIRRALPSPSAGVAQPRTSATDQPQPRTGENHA